MNFDDKDDSAILEKCHNAEQSNTLSEEVTLDVQEEDPCYEVLWRQLEEELKKKNVEERIDAGKFIPFELFLLVCCAEEQLM